MTINVVYSKKPATPAVQTAEVIYRDLDNNDNVLHRDNNLQGPAGQTINYDPTNEISTLKNDGYKLVNNGFTKGAAFDDLTDTTTPSQIFYIDFRHGTRTVDHDHPANPDEPVDPTNHPNDPITPQDHNLSAKDLQKTVTRTINYVVDDAAKTPLRNAVTQTVTFSGEGNIDLVTGKLVTLNDDGTIKDQNGQLKWTYVTSSGKTGNGESASFDATDAAPSFTTDNGQKYKYEKLDPTSISAGLDGGKGAVNSQNVTDQDQNKTVTVYYKPAKPTHTQEAASLNIIDDTTGNQLASYDVSGQDGDAINFTDNQGRSASTQISNYLRHGYGWEKANGNKPIDGSTTDLTADTFTTYNFGKFDNDTKTNQSWTIYLIHKTKQLTPADKYGNESLDKKITRNVQYKYDDGSKAADKVNQTVEFNGEGYIDQVTGQLVQDDGHGHVLKNADGSVVAGTITWKLVNQGGKAVTNGSDSAKFDQIGKPTVGQHDTILRVTTSGDAHYQVNDDGSVDAQNLTHNDNDSNVLIVYHKGATTEHHTAELTVYANGKVVGSAIATGDKGTNISFANAGSIVQAFEDNGYTFDHAEDVSNGKPGTQIADKNTAYNNIPFGKYLTDNNSEQKFAIYLTKANIENSGLKIIDDIENRTLDNYGQSGKTGDSIKFTDGVAQLKYYLNNGYDWHEADKNSTPLTDLNKGNYPTYNFGQYEDNQNPIWTIHLVHQIKPVDHDHPGNGYDSDQLQKTVTTDVSYVDENGKSLGIAPIHNIVTFNGSGYYDAVTKKWTDQNGKVLTDQSKGITWTNNSSTPNGDTATFVKIDAQKPYGYTYAGITGNADPNLTIHQDDGSIDVQTITPTSIDSNIVVHFNKNAAKQGSINVIFHDTTTGQDIYGYGPKNPLIGDENANVTGYTPDQDITALKNKGYEQDTTAAIPSGDLAKMPTTYTAGVQTVYINMKHKIDTINGDNPYGVKATTTITRTVNYHFEDGTTPASHDLKTVTQTANFTGSGHWDEVLKKVVDFANGKETVNADGSVPDVQLTWTTENGKWDTVQAVNVAGYVITHISANSQNNFTINQNTGAVGQAVVDHNSSNATVDIYLNKADQLADLQFVDENNNNQQLALTSASGTVGDPITFVNGQSIYDTLHNEGFEWDAVENKVSDYANYKFGPYDGINDNTQHFTIYLKHHIGHVDHDHPGNGYDSDQLQKTVTTDVSYVDQNDKSIGIAPVHNTVTFNGFGYYDAVSKQWTDQDGKVLNDQSKGISWTYSENGRARQNGDTATFTKIDAQHPAGYTYAGIIVNADPGLTVNKQDGSIAAQTVTPNSANSTVVIRFNKNVAKQGTIEVIYHDNTSDLDLNGYGQTTTKKDQGTGFTYDPNAKDLPALEKLHYVIDGQLPTMPTKYNDGDQRIVIYVKHGTKNEGVSQPVTRDFTYVFNDGTQAADHTTTDGQPVSETAQTITFTGHKTVDLVTGKTVSLDKDGNINGLGGTVWEKSSAELAFVPAKDVKGYHVVSTRNANIDGSVGEVTVTPNSEDIHVRITYAPDDHQAETVVGKQTVHYVDGDNNNAKLLDDNINSTFTFTKDGKTGQWNSESHKYDDANAPIISGYVAEQKTYAGQTATPTDPNKEITIIYHKISTIIPVGKNGRQIPNEPTPTYVNDPHDPTKVIPNERTPHIPGWHITNNPNPGKTTDGKTDNHTVTPADPTKPTKVTYEKDGTTLKNQNSVTASQKVEYQDDHGHTLGPSKTQSFTFIYSGDTYDAVTGDLIKKGTWNVNSHDFTSEIVPNISGYTLVSGYAKNGNSYTVGGFTTDPSASVQDQNRTFIVVYTEMPTKPVVTTGSITYYDDTANQTLESTSFNGNVGDKINYTTADRISHYENLGYDLVSNDFKDGQQIFAKDPSNNIFAVHLKHETENITPDKPDPNRGYTKDNLTKIGTQTIHYIIVGDDSNKPLAPADHIANVKFTHSLTIDKVTGKVIKDDGWTPTSQTFAQVDTPTLAGYEPDKKNIAVKTVTIDPKTGQGTIDDYEVVVYTKTPKTPDEAAGTVIYIDDTARKTLASDALTGQVGNKIAYTTADKIQNYESHGYKLVSNNFRDGEEIFAKTGNNFEVHLKHTLIPINPGTKDKHGVNQDTLEKNVTETVHYIGAGDQTPKDHVQTSKWSKQVTYDEVSKKVVSNGQYDTEWSIERGQKTIYDQVDTPKVPGYHADQANVPATEVTQNNITKTVIYTKNPAVQAHITITYHDDTINTDLKTDTEKPQDVGSKVTYTTQPSISAYVKEGYRLVSNVTIPSVMPQNGFTGVVHLVHTYSPLNPDHPHQGIDPSQYQKDVTATVHYVYSDGTKAHDDNVQHATWTRTLTIDNVTGQILPNGADDKSWTANRKSYDAVNSPIIKGYHANKERVPAKNVTQDNLEETVIYVKNGTTLKNEQTVTAKQTVEYQDDQGDILSPTKTQNFTFTYTGDTYDDHTGKLISKGKWNAENHSFTAENVPVITGYVVVKGYTKNGDNYSAGGFTTDPNASDTQRNRTFIVVYEKIANIVPVDPDHKPIPNPDKPGTNVPNKPYVNDPKDPTKVINETVPTIPGYTPNISTVTPTDPTEPTDVTYTKNPVTDTGTVTITVHDKTTGQNLTQYGYNSDKDGKPQIIGTKIDYNKAQTFTDLINHGYKVTNPDVSIPTTITKGNTSVIIEVEHTTTTVTPDKPGTPEQPIDPTNPNGPKYPTGTDIDQLKKTGTQTIHYTGAGNQTPADSKQSFTFTRQITFDNVTGKITNTTPWNVASHTFTDVDTPLVQGYHADRKSVGGTTIRPDDLDKTIVVTYTSNGKIIPIDQNGQPIPGAPQPVLPTDPDDPSKVDSGKIPSVSGYSPDKGKVGDPVAPNSQDPSQDVKVPYKQSPIPAPSPINPEPATPGTVPAISKPTASKPTSPAQPTTAPKPSEPQKPDVPKGPKHRRQTTTISHKNKTRSRPAAPTAGYNYNNMPHGQNGYWSSNNPPISETTPTGGSNGNNFGPSGQTLPNGDRIMPNGEVVTASGQVVGYVDKNGQVHYTLPQTGEKQNESLVSALAGGIAVSIGLIGLAGVKKKTNHNL